MGRFLIDIPTGRAPESRTIFGQKPTDLRQAYMAALAARQGIGLLGDITPSAKTVGDIKRAFLRATAPETAPQQGVQTTAPTWRPIQQASQTTTISGPQTLADAVGAVNAAQTPEQPAASRQLVKETIAAPTDAASALLLAKAAAASGNAQEFRNALLAARTVDVSDMPEQDAGDLFSDAGKRQRLVKMMLGLRPQKIDPLARRKLDLRERSIAATEVGVGIRGRAEARRMLAENRKQRAQNVLLDAQKKYLEGKTALNDVTKRTKEKLLALGLPEKQVNLVVARMKSALQSAKESRWRMDPKRHAERKELKSLTKPMQINIGAYQKKADIRRKEDARKNIIRLEGKLKELDAIKGDPKKEAEGVWYNKRGDKELGLAQKYKNAAAAREGVRQQLEMWRKVFRGQDIDTGGGDVNDVISEALKE